MNRANRGILDELVYHLSAKKKDDKAKKYIDARVKTNRIVDDENGDLTYLDLSELNAHFKGAKYQPEIIIRDCIGNLQQLTFLSLRDCLIHGCIPNSIGNLVHVEKLDMSKNMLADEIPEEIGRCTCLSQLNLMENQLTRVPASVGNLNMLTQLNLSTNNIDKLPDEIGSCKSLVALYLADNQLTHLPTSISMLVNLNNLDVSKNRFISTIPNCIEKLLNINTLLLAFNDFQGILPSAYLSKCSQLRYLDVSNNTRLVGYLPTLPVDCVVRANGTGLSLVSVRTYKLKKDFCYIDYISVMSYVASKYTNAVHAHRHTHACTYPYVSNVVQLNFINFCS